MLNRNLRQSSRSGGELDAMTPAQLVKHFGSEAKAAAELGYTRQYIYKLLKRNRIPLRTQERIEFDELLDIYERAVGQLAGTPLAEAARPRLVT